MKAFCTTCGTALNADTGTRGDLAVMIPQRGDKPVTIMIKSHISPLRVRCRST